MTTTILALVLGVSLVTYDDAGSAKPNAQIVAAIDKLEQKSSLVFEGSVGKLEKPQPQRGNIMRIVTTVGVGGDGEPFEGEFEVYARPAQQEFGIVSKEVAPGVVIYDDGSSAYHSVVFNDKPVLAKQFGSRVRQMLDLKNLSKYVSRAEDIQTEISDSGNTVFTCRLSNRLIRSGETALPASFGPDLKSIMATFTLDDGELTGLKFVLTYSNPLASMRKQGNMRVQGLPKGMDASKLLSQNFDDSVTVYQLSVGEKASDRTTEQLEMLRKIAEQD